jgi:hypothetical protein
MLGEANISIQEKGKYGSLETPAEWKKIPPESTGAALLRFTSQIALISPNRAICADLMRENSQRAYKQVSRC